MYAFYKVLKGSNFKHQWSELLNEVYKKNDDDSEWVKRFFGQIDLVRNNKKLRDLRTRLKEYVSIHKDQVLALGLSPLTLAWRETYTGGDRDAVIDIDNIVDPEDIEGEPRTTTRG